MMAANPLPISVDLLEAERFLNLLDPTTNQFTFQTFDDVVLPDGTKRGLPELASWRHGTLATHAEYLIRAQSRGAGVFVMVQEGDGSGRNNAAVRRIRALFQEDDGDGLKLPVQPHIVVESSPGKYHRYLKLEGVDKLTFSSMMEVMIGQYGSDKNVKDLARVLRIPGFIHQKGDPFMVRILDANEALPLYGDDVLGPLTISQPYPKQESHDRPSASSTVNAAVLAKVRKIAMDAANRTHDSQSVGRHSEIYKIGCYMRRDGLPGDSDTFTAALQIFSDNMRETNTTGNTSPMNWGTAMKAITEGYWKPAGSDWQGTHWSDGVDVPGLELPPDYTYQHEQSDFDGVFDAPIPGVLGEFEEWAYRSSLSATPSKHAARMAALGFGSIALARLYKTQRDNYSSLLLLQIDDSGGGKEDLKTAIDKAMRLTGLHSTRMGGSWYTSDIGVISALHDKPAHITIVDEFGLKIANSRKKGNSTASSALSAVMEASTKCHSSISSTAAGTRGLSRSDAAKMQMTIVNPGLSVVAMSTKTSMIEALTSDDITSGFLNRWVIMVNPTVTEKPDYSRFFDAQPSFPLPESIRRWVDTHCPLATRLGGSAPECEDASVDVDATIIPFSKPAQALVIQYLDDIEQMKLGVFASAPEMTKRMNESAMRLSLIVALSDGEKTIGAEHFAWARDFITSHQIAAFRVLASQLAGTEFGKLRNAILEFIRSRNDGKPVTRRDLGQSCRSWKESPKHLRDSAIAVLIEDGLIARADVVTTAGRTVITYQGVNHDTADDDS